jgi:hypothetical protein
MFLKGLGNKMASALASFLAAVSLQAAAAPDGAGVAPDFSSVGSVESAAALAAQGKLVRVLLFPAEFGGDDIPQNAVYITPEAAAARELALGTISRMIEKGLLDRMEVSPVYKGKSFVPASLVFKAWHSSKEGRFEPTIEVW